MEWIKRYHEDHMSVLTLLAGLEGTLKDLEYGLDRPYMKIEFAEIARVIKEILLPHFQSEEKDIYPKVARLDESGKELIDVMLEEHQSLYTAFDSFIKAYENDDKKLIIESGKTIVHVLRHHIIKEEKSLPRYFEEELNS